jgi:hypothetical protein
MVYLRRRPRGLNLPMMFFTLHLSDVIGDKFLWLKIVSEKLGNFLIAKHFLLGE